MQGLLDFLRKHLYWLVFLALEAISLVSLVRFNSYQASVWFTTANELTGTLMGWASGAWNYVHLNEQNARLEQANQALRQQNLQLRQMVRRARADRASLGPDTIDSVFEVRVNDSVVRTLTSRRVVSYSLVEAQVVGATLHRANNLLTIDRGRADGLRPEMGVISSDGVVGITYLCSDHYTLVLPLVNTQSQVSCRLYGSDYFGTMQWERGDAALSYAVNIPRHATVKKGLRVETNGYSDIFPEGIPIGRVTSVGDSPDGMSYRLGVRLAVDFGTLRNVSVITNYTQPERKQLEARADSLASGQTPARP